MTQAINKTKKYLSNLLSKLTENFNASLFIFSIVFLSLSILAFIYLYMMPHHSPDIPDFPTLTVEPQSHGNEEKKITEEIFIKYFDAFQYNYSAYVALNEETWDFTKKVIILLILSIIVMISLFSAVLYNWLLDRKKLTIWYRSGFACERLEFLDGNRVRLNSTEIILNKTQLETLKKLALSRVEKEALHPTELSTDNATQMIKRLREELGAKILEKTLIKNHRGKGYWIEVKPEKIKGLNDD